jgi:protocatechuate 3,4-dioxygenase, beta subunit
MRIPTAFILISGLLLIAVCNKAQDSAFVRSWEEAQKNRPQNVPSSARIASTEEPGTPLRILGMVYLSDGETPATGVVVFTYQTDRSGVYNERGSDGWRLRGWARTDREGRFEFHTIRPGAYPGRSNPAHVHFTLDGPELRRRWTDSLLFADDPLVTRSERQRSDAAEKFGWVRPVRKERDGTTVVEINLKAEAANVF